MPHSTGPDAAPQEDSVLSDAPALPLNGEMEPEANEDEMSVDGASKSKARSDNVNLEDMFNTDDEDDEFPSSSPPGTSSNVHGNNNKDNNNNKAGSPPPGAEQAERYSDPDVMLAFYQRLYPFRPLFQWLNHAVKPSNDFGNREFAFTLQNDAYLRYQSFPTADLLRKETLRLNPSRFEIGPVYSTNPRDRKSLRKASTFRPVSKELVFDIDLTDYDEIRTCCAKAAICRKCWAFVTMAIKVVDAALRQDFGFRHVLWVYSGRRGAHAWVSDRRARELDDARRRAIAGYLDVVRGGGGRRVQARRPLHAHLARSLELLAPHFATDVLEAQDPWRAPERAERLLAALPDRPLAEALRRKWDSAALAGRSSAARWADIDALARAGASPGLDARALLEAKKDVVLEYGYPRLDAEVSKKLNHLLKAPFVVHPKTGRVCVPIDVASLDGFDPEAVPTVTDLLREIDDWKGEEGDGDGGGDRAAPDAGAGGARRKAAATAAVQDYEKTRLKGYVDFFKAHVARMLKDERGVKREEGGGHDDDDDDGGADAMEF